MDGVVIPWALGALERHSNTGTWLIFINFFIKL